MARVWSHSALALFGALALLSAAGVHAQIFSDTLNTSTTSRGAGDAPLTHLQVSAPTGVQLRRNIYPERYFVAAGQRQHQQLRDAWSFLLRRRTDSIDLNDEAAPVVNAELPIPALDPMSLLWLAVGVGTLGTFVLRRRARTHD